MKKELYKSIYQYILFRQEYENDNKNLSIFGENLNNQNLMNI